MSQQELVPEPQDQNASGQSYRYKAPQHTGDGPKEEHPATFEETIPPYSYPAQDRVTYTGEKVRQQPRARQRQSFGDDGDAFEMGYRPYQQYRHRQVPPWVRPQRQAGVHILRWMVAIGLIVLTIKILPFILLGLLGVAAFILVLPLIILFSLAVAALVIVILALLGMRGAMRSNRRWGRPWI